MVLEFKNHRKTIDINGDFPSIHSMAMVSIKRFIHPFSVIQSPASVQDKLLSA